MIRWRRTAPPVPEYRKGGCRPRVRLLPLVLPSSPQDCACSTLLRPALRGPRARLATYYRQSSLRSASVVWTGAPLGRSRRDIWPRGRASNDLARLEELRLTLRQVLGRGPADGWRRFETLVVHVLRCSPSSRAGKGSSRPNHVRHRFASRENTQSGRERSDARSVRWMGSHARASAPPGLAVLS